MDIRYWTYTFENGITLESKEFISENDLREMISDFGKVIVNFVQSDLVEVLNSSK